MSFLTQTCRCVFTVCCWLLGFHCSLTAQAVKDSIQLRGEIGLTGLVQTGDETRTVLSLLSDLRIGNKRWQAEPLSSIAYSNKPHKQVEGEYLENLLLRYHPLQKVYPAIGLLVEHSLLKKIKVRNNIVVVAVWKWVEEAHSKWKLAPGIGYEWVRYEPGSIQADGADSSRRKMVFVYGHIKGEQAWKLLRLHLDFFYQASMRALSDNRWYGIAALDCSFGKIISFRTSLLYSYESVLAKDVAHYNFRLTYGIGIKL